MGKTRKKLKKSIKRLKLSNKLSARDLKKKIKNSEIDLFKLRKTQFFCKNENGWLVSNIRDTSSSDSSPKYAIKTQQLKRKKQKKNIYKSNLSSQAVQITKTNVFTKVQSDISGVTCPISSETSEDSDSSGLADFTPKKSRLTYQNKKKLSKLKITNEQKALDQTKNLERAEKRVTKLVNGKKKNTKVKEIKRMNISCDNQILNDTVLDLTHSSTEDDTNENEEKELNLEETEEDKIVTKLVNGKKKNISHKKVNRIKRMDTSSDNQILNDTVLELTHSSIADETRENFEEKELSLEETEREKIRPNQANHLSNCLFYVLNNDSCIAVLKHPTKLYFHGIMKVTNIFGKCEILGYVLQDSTEIVYSLRGSCFLCFETLISSEQSIPTDRLRSLGLGDNVISSLESTDCILKFQYHHSNPVNFVNKCIEQNLMPVINESDQVEKILQSTFGYKAHKGFLYKKNFEWDYISSAIESNVNTSRTVVCGGKSVGKSTLIRYIANQLLMTTKQVLLIDLDIGQSEFSISGCVSATEINEPMLGSSFTHLKKPLRSYCIGAVSVLDNLERYFQSVKQLLNYCHNNEQLKNVPWLINTMGFVQGLGNDIAIHLIRMLAPTIVVQITSEKYYNNFLQPLLPDFVSETITNYKLPPSMQSENYPSQLNYQFITIGSVVNSVGKDTADKWSLHPRMARQVNILSYISSLFNADGDIRVQPFICNIDNLKLISLKGVICDKIVSALFNGNFVSLCSEENITNYLHYICYGFGIIQGIDNNEIYLLTPLPLKDLKQINTLIIAADVLPSCFYLKTQFLPDTLVPYVSVETQSIKTTQIPRRIKFNILNVKNILQVIEQKTSV